jgi:hypothetical protein
MYSGLDGMFLNVFFYICMLCYDLRKDGWGLEL